MTNTATSELALSIDDMLADLQALVEVESPSHDIARLEQSAAVLGAIIEKRLGGTVTYIDSDGGRHLRWSGGGEPRVLLLGHHDTVFPVGTLERRPFLVTDGVATGPGVFDMLGGLVQGIHGLASLDDYSGVEILINADEEVGSASSRELIEQVAGTCRAALVLEGAAPGGALKTARKGTGTFQVVVTGRASHAGLNPEDGANALVEASRLVGVINQFGDPASGTTVTPTVATAGTATNVVPAEASIMVDVRIETAAEQRRVEAAFASLTAELDGCAVEIRHGFNRPPMPEEISVDLFAMAQRVQPGVVGVAVGGGSDGNFTAAIGVPTLDGLGAVGGGAHADDEHLEVVYMAERAALVAGLIEEIRAG